MAPVYFPEYDHTDGIGLARLVREGQISVEDIYKAAVDRVERRNPLLNAVIGPLLDMKRETAGQEGSDAVFFGVPFLLKDAHHALAGVPMSCGSALLKNFIPRQDAEIVKRFLNAGLIPIGKSNTPEFKLSYLTAPAAFGPTRNPWNPDYASGGSSGGSAAAVSARIVPLGSATDEGGSIRVPSAYCGVFGLKPSRGRNPVGPDFNEEWDGMSCSHVITRSVRDSAAVLDAVCGPETGAPYTASPPSRSFLSEIEHPPERLKIGYYVRSAYGRDVHPECRKAIDHTCKLLENLGHAVTEVEPVYKEEDAAFHYFVVLISNTAAHVEGLIKTYGRSKVCQGLELPTRALHSIGSRLKTVDFIKAKREWRRLGATMGRMLSTYDLMLTPTLGQPPIPCDYQTISRPDQWAMKFFCTPLSSFVLGNRKLVPMIIEQLIQNTMRHQMPFTLIANMTGQPAMSVPLYWSETVLPCGVQFLGRLGDEATLLKLAAQLEDAAPWAKKMPPILSREG